MRQPSQVTDLEIDIDYGQVYLYGESPWRPGEEDDPGNTAVLRALDDANAGNRRVGTADGVVDVISAVQWHWNAPMRVEVWEEEPPLDLSDFDDVVDVDIDLASGVLHFQASGGSEEIARCEVPAGRYRARIGGRGYDEATAGGAVEGGPDSYRVQLWARRAEAEPAVRKKWSGRPG
ncbi:MAG: hypothetical protein ACRDRH_19995 [Pseudonocardia sp.]